MRRAVIAVLIALLAGSVQAAEDDVWDVVLVPSPAEAESAVDHAISALTATQIEEEKLCLADFRATVAQAFSSTRLCT